LNPTDRGPVYSLRCRADSLHVNGELTAAGDLQTAGERSSGPTRWPGGRVQIDCCRMVHPIYGKRWHPLDLKARTARKSR
jgi:hypothetical protein